MGGMTINEPNPQLEERKISATLKENVAFLENKLGINVGFDIGLREMKLAGRDAAILYINGFTKDLDLLQILRRLDLAGKDEKSDSLSLEQICDRYLDYLQISLCQNMEQAVNHLLSGRTVFFFDHENQALAIEARQYPSRGPKEPDIERVVRGSRDGFTETIVVNTALIRRRIRDPRLRFALVEVGRRSKTDVVIAYIEDVANPELVQKIKKRIEAIRIDGIPMAEKAVEEFLTKGEWNPFPKVRYTERPDVAAMHLLEGHVLVMVDTSPSVIVAPATFWHHLQHAEEYRQNPFIGAYVRWIRFLAVLVSMLVLPLWFLFAANPQLLPPGLKFIGPKEMGSVPLLGQIVIAELGLDIIRLATIHTPSPLTTALGLIATFMIGQVAIDVGLFSPEVVLYIAISAVGTFATPSYELAMSNRIIRLGLILAIGIFGWYGLVGGAVLALALVVMTRSFGIPYFWPILPFNAKGALASLIRMPATARRIRPTILRPIDSDRQPPARRAKEDEGDAKDEKGEKGEKGEEVAERAPRPIRLRPWGRKR